MLFINEILKILIQENWIVENIKENFIKENFINEKI